MDVKYTENGMVINGSLIPWTVIDEERNKIRFANSVLVTMSFRYGREEYSDKFIMNKEEWEVLKAQMLGTTVELYEFAGKHSEVDLEITEGLITEETDLDVIVAFHENYGFSSNDVNIVDTWRDQEAG